MTLYELVFDGGIVLSFVLLTILGLMWPSRHPRFVISFADRPEELGTLASFRARLRHAVGAGAKEMLARPTHARSHPR